MGITIATLQEHIKARSKKEVTPAHYPLGRGFYIAEENGVLFIISDAEPGERAVCGFVDYNLHNTWVIYREWAIELRATFGTLPSRFVIDGSLDAA